MTCEFFVKIIYIFFLSVKISAHIQVFSVSALLNFLSYKHYFIEDSSVKRTCLLFMLYVMFLNFEYLMTVSHDTEQSGSLIHE